MSGRSVSTKDKNSPVVNETEAEARPSAADRTYQVLLAHLRHEMLTPINAVLGYTDILLDEVEEQGLEVLEPDLKKIRTAGAQLLDLVDTLLSPDGIEAGLSRIDVEELGRTLRHNLRTPLNAIIGYSEMLMEDAVAAGRPEIVADLEKIHQAAARFVGFINDIVNFSKIVVGAIDGEIFDAGAILREIRTVITPEPHTVMETPVGSGGRVLVVDDNDFDRDLLCRQLQRQGFAVTAANGGRHALELLDQSDFDLVILDIVMPEVNGFEVLEAIKRNEDRWHIPVLMISEFDELESVIRAIEAGAEDFIPKRYVPVLLQARVGACLAEKARRDKELEDIRHVRLLTEAATDVEAGRFEPEKLNGVAECSDELGRLARVFQRMAHDVCRREEQLRKAREEEAQLLEITTALSSELNLGRLLIKIMDTTKELLSADRCTLFMHDAETGELWSRVAQGLETSEIRIPSHLGIAGSVFTDGRIINIPDAYADPRFNQAVDRSTGYRTKSILCMPVRNKDGRIIGVTQVLNKVGGPFLETDERRLAAFSAQASIALENAQLFEDVLNMKNYNESMLESMSNGVISLSADGLIVKCNSTARRILKVGVEELIGRPAAEFFSGPNQWVADSVAKVNDAGRADLVLDTDLVPPGSDAASINLSTVPLTNSKGENIGALLVLEDITREKRLKGTMARYMTKEVADRLLECGEAVLGGQTQEAAVMFADIRDFTGLSENIGPQETVGLLNDYFSIMVDVIFKYEGILDKYIGDAIMAVFGAPISTGRDSENAVAAAVDMMTALREFNRSQRADGLKLDIGIGVNTAEVLSGNIGSLKRMDYTVIGDGVNVASRLEGANKFYGTRILITESTHSGLGDGHVCREIDLIRVKGKVKPVSIYQILDYCGEDDFPRLQDVLDLFHQGLRAYRGRDWARGLDFFTRALDLNDRDHPSRLYADRCRHYLDQPPGDDWEGVWVMTSK